MWSVITLAIVLGVGVHSSKESLGPAEPALESALGIGPVVYAMLTIAPTALSLVTPMLWGALWTHHANYVLIGAPFGELFGAASIGLGLHILVREEGSNGLLTLVLCAGGLVVGSACRAGISVAEFVAVGEASGSEGSELGFAALVVAKHANGVVMAWGVPLLVASTRSTIHGLLRVQLATLVPHLAALLAGCLMARRHKPQHPAAQPLGFTTPTSSVPTPSVVSAKRSPAPMDVGVPEGLPQWSQRPKRKQRLSRESMLIAGTALCGVPMPIETLPDLAAAAGTDEAQQDEATEEAQARPEAQAEAPQDEESANAAVERVGGTPGGAQGGAQGGRPPRASGGQRRPRRPRRPSMEDAAHEIEVAATFEVLEQASRQLSGSRGGSGGGGGGGGEGSEGGGGGMRRSASMAQRMADLLLPKQQLYVVLLLGAWRALAVGTLHAYHSVRIALVMSTFEYDEYSADDAGGFSASSSAAASASASASSSSSSSFSSSSSSSSSSQQRANEEAGALMATTDLVAMLLLGALGPWVTRRVGLRPLLMCAPLLGLAACLVLIEQQLSRRNGRGPPQMASLLLLSLIEVVTPILPLALVPAAAGDVLGTAYGTIEFMFASVQMAITLSLGAIRSHEDGGFLGALCLTSAGFVAATLVALPLMARGAAGERGAAGTSREVARAGASAA